MWHRRKLIMMPRARTPVAKKIKIGERTRKKRWLRRFGMWVGHSARQCLGKIVRRADSGDSVAVRSSTVKPAQHWWQSRKAPHLHGVQLNAELKRGTRRQSQCLQAQMTNSLIVIKKVENSLAERNTEPTKTTRRTTNLCNNVNANASRDRACLHRRGRN